MNKNVLALAGLALSAWAVDTRYWSQEGQADFEKGTVRKVALRNDGRLTLSPAMRELGDASLPYLFAAVAGPNGSIYAAGGPSGALSPVFELGRDGALKKLGEVPGMNVFALATDRQGRVYAGSSPDGKIYRLAPGGKAEEFYDPKAKYIWAMAFLAGGDLLVATGDKGELHRVNAAGMGKLWLKLEEDHVRSLLVDAKGTVYIGTDPNGLIVKVDGQGNPFVVHQAAKKEVTALAAGRDGSIYAAVIGQKLVGGVSMAPLMSPPVVAPPPPAQGAAGANRPASVPAMPPPASAPAVPGGSEIVQIDSDGAPRRIWMHERDLVYALALDSQDRLVVGSGNKGNLYRIEGATRATLLGSLASTQVTALVRAGDRLVAVTGNIGKFHELGSGLEASGSYESEVFDGAGFTQWGRVHTKESRNGGTIRIETRSGNLDRPTQMWSPWTELKEGRVVSPPARFLQWRATLSGGQGEGPELTQVDIAYLPRNVAPRVEAVEATPANYRFPATGATILPAVQTMTLPPIGKPSMAPAAAAQNDGANSPSLTYARGMIGARWLALDDNQDTLEFSLEIRGAGEQTWKPLKDKLRERYYSWDMTGFADGRYQLKVTATDAPANPLNQGLKAEAVSTPFLIDNTAPVISELAASPSGNRFSLRFRAIDKWSVVTKAEVALNGGDWRLVEPTVRLADSKELEFQLLLDRPAPGEVTIAVRLTDEFDNQSVEKLTLR
ncbi:MAG: hypothetical protein ACK6DX_02775 [Acidobacteriota bacterium]